MNKFTKFFHELIHPHCEHCVQVKREELEQLELNREASEVCKTCETLKLELAHANNRIDQLLNNLIAPKTEAAPIEEVAPKIINRRDIPWSVMRQKLEADSRARAEKLKNEQSALNSAAKPDVTPEIKELEQALNIEADTNARNTA